MEMNPQAGPKFEALHSAPLQHPSRRAFLVSAGGVFGAVALWSLHRSANIVEAGDVSSPSTVTIVQFSTDGKRIGKVTVPRIAKPEDAWKHQLSPLSFEVTRRAGTERPYSGSLLNVHDRGIFRCICCDNAIFSSDTKFESGTGWPSFWQPIAPENIVEVHDGSFGMDRTEVKCRECDAHLGHVFNDGPHPTGLRYCMNSAAMTFVKLA